MHYFEVFTATISEQELLGSAGQITDRIATGMAGAHSNVHSNFLVFV